MDAWLNGYSVGYFETEIGIQAACQRIGVPFRRKIQRRMQHAQFRIERGAEFVVAGCGIPVDGLFQQKVDPAGLHVHRESGNRPVAELAEERFAEGSV